MPTAVHERVHGTPHSGLGPAVTGYLGYRTSWPGPASWQLLPRGFVVVLFDLERCGALVAGLHDRPVRFTQTGRCRGIAAFLRPTTASALLDGELSGSGRQWCDLVDRLGAVAHGLLDRLAAAADWPSRFALLDQFLLTAPVPRADLADLAWQRLCEVGGTLSITALAAELSVSTRTLEIHFHRQIGVSPKNAARILRFHRAARLLGRTNAGLTRIAHDCGFTDHAHFAREVRAMTGRTPTELRSGLRQFGFIQAQPEQRSITFS